MKAAIRKYCSEGHDIMNATNMRGALEKRPVKGTTAAVGLLNESKNKLKIRKMDHVSELHNFMQLRRK
jgi:hypothetical protein